MDKYRKKPVIIEAVQFDGLNPTEIKDFVGEHCEVEIYDNKVTPPVASIVIHTLEGDMEVSKGDYVIRGVKGEFYPCKPDIFEQTYESAETQKELEEAAEEYIKKGRYLPEAWLVRPAFIAGAEWQARQLLQGSPMPEDTVLFNKGVAEGRRLMMEDAVEGEVIVPIYEGDDTWSAEIKIPGRYEIGQKVRIIVVKADEE